MTELHGVSRLVSLGAAALLSVVVACGGDDPAPQDGGNLDASTSDRCESFGCAPHQLCRDEGGGIACVDDMCEPGFVWDGSACERDETASCDGAGSIVLDCAELNRECVATADGAVCADCGPGYIAEGSACAPDAACDTAGCPGMQRMCAATGCGACLHGFADEGGTCNPASCDGCTLLHRACEEEGGVVRCGACDIGFVQNADFECERLVTCDELDCASMNRTCSMSPNAQCDEACVAGYVWDAETERCQMQRSCADLDCEAMGQVCVDTGEGEPTCVMGCPDDQGFDPTVGTDGGCRSCGSAGIASATRCNGDGETGRLIVEESRDDAACFCETRDGWFRGDNNRAEECDADDDGWVRLDAQIVIEDDFGPVRDNARCGLRSVSSIEFLSEGQSPGMGTTVALDSPLPLYESSRNDGLTTEPRPDFGSGPVPAAAINSLTRACVTASADFNDNRIPDVEEGQGDELPEVAPFASGSLRTYFETYLENSYYLELHDGWYAPAAEEGAPGTYIIRERSRLMALAHVAEEVVGFDAGVGTEYWRACTRHDDPLYSTGVDQSEGGDFVECGDDCQMQHHSSFRCMLARTDADYGVAGADTHPWLGYSVPGSGTLFWSHPMGTVLSRRVGRANACSVTGASYGLGVEARNPSNIAYACSSVDTVDPNSVYWVVRDYINAATTAEGAPPMYGGGCINECDVNGVESCPTFLPGRRPGGFQCDQSADADYGRIECGCLPNYSGPDTSCGLACGESSTFHDPNLTTFNRANESHWASEPGRGYWACIDPVATGTTGDDPAFLSGGSYRLRGAIPASPSVTDNTTLSGGDYTLSTRIRAQVSTFGE